MKNMKANEIYSVLMRAYNTMIENERDKKYIDNYKKNNEKAKVKKNTKKENKAKNVFRIQNPTLESLRNGLKQFKGKSVIVEYIVNNVNNSKFKHLQNNLNKYNTDNGYKKQFDLKQVNRSNIVRSKEYNIPQDWRNFWDKSGAYYDWWYDYDIDIFTKMENKGSIFIYPESENLDTKQIIQLFRDGISHCVFTPIRNWAISKLEESSAEKTRYRYSGMIKKINEFESKYADGVPENVINEICNSLQIDINIELPFCENKFIEAKSTKKRLKLFKFMNTRLNHIDLNEIVQNDEFEIVSRKELLSIQSKLDETNSYYTYKKDKIGVCSISTLSKNYKLSNEFSEIISKFEIDTGLNFCKIDDIDDFNLSQFIRQGTNYNGTVDFQKLNVSNIKLDEEQRIIHCEVNGKVVNHIDMTKAYANFKKCKFYSGFLGKITDFRQTDKINGIGMYKITDLQIPEGKFCNYNSKLQIYLNDNVYTSVELQLLDYHKATYKIVSGCWGVSPLDFDFTEEMMNNRDDEDIPYYSKWTGVCDQHKLEKKFWIKGSSDYFKVIRDNLGNGVVKWYDNNEGCIAFPKKHNYHLGHISSFITAYQRINMIEQLMEIDEDKVVRVCVD